MFLIELELFVQHSVSIEGEHGDRWTPHWGTFPVDEEEIYCITQTGWVLKSHKHRQHHNCKVIVVNRVKRDKDIIVISTRQMVVMRFRNVFNLRKYFA